MTKQNIIKNCIFCGKEFISYYGKTKRFCNKNCYYKYWVSNNPNRVWNIKRKYYEKNKDIIYLRNKEFIKSHPNNIKNSKNKYKQTHGVETRFRNKLYILNHPDQYKAKKLSQYWTELKPFCEICNSTNRLERHHWRYDKPLLINTLCKSCHIIQYV